MGRDRCGLSRLHAAQFADSLSVLRVIHRLTGCRPESVGRPDKDSGVRDKEIADILADTKRARHTPCIQDVVPLCVRRIL